MVFPYGIGRAIGKRLYAIGAGLIANIQNPLGYIILTETCKIVDFLILKQFVLIANRY